MYSLRPVGAPGGAVGGSELPSDRSCKVCVAHARLVLGDWAEVAKSVRRAVSSPVGAAGFYLVGDREFGVCLG
ncbi:hypothetical protein Ssi02_33150 [Sinosporangium siamense]|uniref:Uncharacterized protein n=1 Tax=Sinosporangium siamense TaxID=1367973 RepID=A0A919RJK4_9ACTN|nr:hypothetical protein Ssi02_33150 [Sinosporangium siamense]